MTDARYLCGEEADDDLDRAYASEDSFEPYDDDLFGDDEHD